MLRKIILTHIPRTGGTSLFAALKTQQPNAKAISIHSYSELAMIKDSELNSYDLISTYFGSKVFDRLDGSWTKAVLLRNPIARLKSSYWNLRTSRENISFASASAKSLGFRDYLSLRDAAVIFQATNPQTWTVLGDRSAFYRQKFAEVDNQEIVAMAVERLNAYDFVGFTENLDEFWACLCQQFDWSVTRLPRLRANPPFEIDEDALIEDLDFHTDLDAQLVRIAREKQESCLTDRAPPGVIKN